MKKTLALILAVLMVVALFAGCGKDTTTPTTPGTDTPSSSAPSTGTEGTDTPDAPVEEDSPYNFAKGKFEYNADGYVDENYSYELPLSTTDEILTNWTTFWLPQYIPEGGMKELETLAYMEEITGVHIEYEVISSEQRSTNFSVLLASDDLRDIMDGATSSTPASPDP